jgi:photosystem II stability/assembly factor-like uncharacterized protein
MDDLRRRFATLDRVPVPDVWNEVERRLAGFGSTAPSGRLVAVQPAWRGTRAERSGRSSTSVRGRRTIALLAAALIAALLIGGVLAVGSGLVRMTSVVPPSLEATPATSPGPSPTVASPSPSIAATPTPPNAFPARPGMFAELRDFRPASDTVGWVTTSSAIYRTTDNGRTWTDVQSPVPTSTTKSATALVDTDTIYVASGSSPATIAATHDGGATWVEASLDVGAITGGPAFTFQAPMRGFATFYDPEGTGLLRVFATTDGGVTWTGPKDGTVPHMAASFDKLSDPLGGFFSQRSGKFDDKPFDNRFFLSADGAASWTEYRFPTGPLAPKDELKEIVDIVQDDGGPITMAIMVNGSDGAVYEATADPASWRSVRTLPGPDVQLLSSTTWVVAQTHAEFRSTVDAGEHWRTRETSTPFRQLPRFATPDDGWVVVGCNPDSILPQDLHCDGTTKETILFATSDGGTTWIPIVH